MIDKVKTDPKLGLEIYEMLRDKGIETPMVGTPLSDEQQVELIKNNVREIMETLGLDLTDDSLCETPKRVAKMFVNELFAGLDYHNFPKITVVENKMGYNSMLLERNIKVKSVCEHHLVAFMGEATIAYIPDNKVIGISKLNRVVEFFSRRPQIQERLTEQIFYTLQYLLGTEDVAVTIRAEHFCVKLRGVEDINSDTVTSRLGGVFATNEKTRLEFYNLQKC